MNQLLALLSTANFIAAGVFFLLGSLQPAVPSETSVASAEVAMENSLETTASAQDSLPPVEAEMRTESRAAEETEPAAGPVSSDQQKVRSSAMAETQAGDKPRPGAESLPTIPQDRETRLMAEPAEQRPETIISTMRGEDVDEPEQVMPTPESLETRSHDQARQTEPAPRTVAQNSTDSSQAQAGNVDAEGFEEIFILSEDSYSPGEYLLSGDALRRIDLIAGRAVKGGYRIVVEGHADSVPVASSQRVKYSSNQELSLLRASVVAERLIVSGIDPFRITVLGHGDSLPVASNLTPEGRALNRRVEVKLLPERGPAVAKVSTPTTSAE